MPLTELSRIYIRGTVTQHPYRTKRVTDAFMIVARDGRTRELEDELAVLAGVRPDNHVVYAITSDWRPVVVFDHIEVRGTTGTLYAWFHDTEIFFGNTIEK